VECEGLRLSVGSFREPVELRHRSEARLHVPAARDDDRGETVHPPPPGGAAQGGAAPRRSPRSGAAGPSVTTVPRPSPSCATPPERPSGRHQVDDYGPGVPGPPRDTPASPPRSPPSCATSRPTTKPPPRPGITYATYQKRKHIDRLPVGSSRSVTIRGENESREGPDRPHIQAVAPGRCHRPPVPLDPC
jgi:hypothetical protein